MGVIMIEPGEIIVIDGPDGTGKDETTKRVRILANERKPFSNLEVLTQSFPRYKSFYGKLIRAYLDGDEAHELLRVPDDVRLDPICASAMYALDRHRTYQEIMKPNMDKGHWYLCDRYYTSNMGHQGSRMNTMEERLAFFERLMWLEEGYCQLPRPKVVVILDLPEEVRRDRTERRRKKAEDDNALDGKVAKTDIHEQSPEHMRRASDTYRQMAEHFNWPLINGVENGRELTPDEMAEKVYGAILKQLG